MTIVVLGIAEQTIAQDLRAQLEEMPDLTVVAIAESSHELVKQVLQQDVDIAIIHDRLGPEPFGAILRDLNVRRPATSTLVLSADANPRVYAQALDGAARGVLTYPVLLEELQPSIDGAAEWSKRLRSLMTGETADNQALGRGKIVTVVGAKGGVGATLIATHLAWDISRSVSNLRVALVDLALGAGDVPGYIGVNYRVSIADLAKVHEDISDRAVADSVTVHDSGLHLLLTPPDIRDTDFVTPVAVRQILDAMRSGYDLVIVDGGSIVTPVQASAVELSDEVVVVVAPDVPNVRALRRTTGAWDTLGAVKPDQVSVVVNKQDRQDEIQPETLAELAGVPVVTTVIPEMYRQLESAINSRDPAAVRSQAWWNGLRNLANSLSLVPSATGGRAMARGDAVDARVRAGRKGRRRAERGQIAIENIAMFPILFFLLLLIGQLIAFGSSVLWAEHGADVAARAASVGATPAQYTAAARSAVPVGGSRVTATLDSGSSRMTVRVPIPMVVPGIMNDRYVDRTVPVVKEPS